MFPAYKSYQKLHDYISSRKFSKYVHDIMAHLRLLNFIKTALKTFNISFTNLKYLKSKNTIVRFLKLFLL